MPKAKATASPEQDLVVETTVEPTVDTSADVLAEIVRQNESQPGNNCRDFRK
jgi:hypothetical protein